MLRITADIFSGRPNPSWVIDEEKEAREAFTELLAGSTASTARPSEGLRLGLRGFEISAMGDGFAPGIGSVQGGYLSVQSLSSAADGRSRTDRLRALIEKAPFYAPSADQPDADGSVRALVLEQIQETVLGVVRDAAPQPPSSPQHPIPDATCTIDTLPYNRTFWNIDPHIQQNNNCYNYASNRRTDTYAQPGKGGGQIWRRITCHEVTQALIRDGLRVRYHCFPDSERPRQLIALVIWPPEHDFHFYRLMTDRFWGHKMGNSPVVNYDSRLEFIYNVETCARGPYTDFCSYWYTCRSQRIL